MAEKTTTGRLLAAGGGILLIVSLFLSWYGFDVGGLAGQYMAAVDTSASGWQSLDIGDFVFLIVGLLAIAPAAFDIFDLEIELPFDVSFVSLIASPLTATGTGFEVSPGPNVSVPEVAVKSSGEVPVSAAVL